MNRIIKGIVWLLFAVIVYLLTAEAVSRRLALPTLGNIGFTVIFVSFSVLHCALCEGGRRTGLFFAVAAIVSYTLEETGVRTGLIYGRYHYSDLLGPKLGHVPVLIPLAWFMLIYPSWVTARALLRGVNTRSVMGSVSLAVIAAIVMSAWDTVMDPGMAGAGNWVWEKGGGYFGVPLRNYAGWLLTTFIVYCGAGLIWRVTQKHDAARLLSKQRTMAGFAALPVIVYAVDGARYVLEASEPALHVVALFAMLMPGLLALMQIWMPRERVTSSAAL